MNMYHAADLFQPGRLKDFKQTQKNDAMSLLLNRICKKPMQPTYQEYQELNHSMIVGDPQMEKVVNWVFENPKKHRPMFNTALYKGVDQLTEPAPVLEEFFAYVEKKPDWADFSKFNDAVKFIHRLGMNYGFVSRDLALMFGYMYPGLNQPLLATGALNKSVSLRMAETTKWFIDVTEIDSMERFSAGFTSTIYVRFIHSLVRRQLASSPKWDKQQWGTPINQYDMALTNVAFSQVILLGVRALGVMPTKKEIKSFLHFWKYAGWLMGVEERWLPETEWEAWRLLYWLRFVHPDADESSKILGLSLAQEPLGRKYPELGPLTRKYPQILEYMPKIAYQQHLGMSRFFLGKGKLKKLGVETNVLPWFPLVIIPRNLVLYNVAKAVPSVRHFLTKRGRMDQKLGFSLYHPEGNVGLASMHQ